MSVTKFISVDGGRYGTFIQLHWTGAINDLQQFLNDCSIDPIKDGLGFNLNPHHMKIHVPQPDAGWKTCIIGKYLICNIDKPSTDHSRYDVSDVSAEIFLKGFIN